MARPAGSPRLAHDTAFSFSCAPAHTWLLFKCKEPPAYSGNPSEADLKPRGAATRL